jgi:hypothetical protein
VDRAYDAVLSLVKNDQAAENEDMTFMDYVPSADDRESALTYNCAKNRKGD